MHCGLRSATTFLLETLDDGVEARALGSSRFPRPIAMINMRLSLQLVCWSQNQLNAAYSLLPWLHAKLQKQT